jgi:hypothetical protein
MGSASSGPLVQASASLSGSTMAGSSSDLLSGAGMPARSPPSQYVGLGGMGMSMSGLGGTPSGTPMVSGRGLQQGQGQGGQPAQGVLDMVVGMSPAMGSSSFSAFGSLPTFSPFPQSAGLLDSALFSSGLSPGMPSSSLGSGGGSGFGSVENSPDLMCKSSGGVRCLHARYLPQRAGG